MVALNYAPTLAPSPGPSPDALALQQAYAKQLLAGSDQPIHSWSQGVAGIVDALVGGTIARKSGEKQAAGEASAADQFSQLLMGGTYAPSGESAPAMPEPTAGGDISGLSAMSMADGGAAPVAATPAATGAPAISAAQRAMAMELIRNPFAQPAQKAYALKMLQPPSPPEEYNLPAGTARMRGNQVIASRPAEPPSPSDDIKEYNLAKEQGYPGTLQDWLVESDARRRQVLSPEEQTKALEEGEKVKEFVKMAGTTAADLGAADELSDGVDRLEGLLKGVDTGSEAALTQWVAETTGVPLGENAGKLQAVSALTTYLAQKMRSPGSGPASDTDVAMFLNSLPSVIRQPGGNELIIQTMRAMAHQRVANAQISQDYLAGTIDRKKALELQRSLPDPFADFKKAAPDLPKSDTTGGSAREGAIGINRQTGEKIILKGGRWVPLTPAAPAAPTPAAPIVTPPEMRNIPDSPMWNRQNG